MDLTILATDVKMVEARKELWELMAAYSVWMEEWKHLHLCEVSHSQFTYKMMFKHDEIIII